MERLKVEYILSGALQPVVSVSELHHAKRTKMYKKGGIFFISSPVLTQDLLKNVIDRKIHSIFILTPEKCLRKKEENFILNLAKSKGLQFHHCLSNSPIQIAKNFRDLMSSLMVSKSHIFARFHELVKLDVRSTETIVNYEARFTDTMKEMQRILLDLMSKEVKEIKKSGVDLGSYSVELFSTWGGLRLWIEERYEPKSDLVDARGKECVANLREIQVHLFSLIYHSAVEFYSNLKNRYDKKIEQKDLKWLNDPQASKLHELAKMRVFHEKGDLKVEIFPKWEAFINIIGEIKKTASTTRKKVLITCRNAKSGREVLALLKKSPEEILEWQYRRFILNPDSGEEVSEEEELPKVGELDIFLFLLDNDPGFGIESVIYDMRPDFVVIYEVNLKTIREVEHAKASLMKSKCKLSVFSVSYVDTVDEAQFVSTKNSEIRAFEYLLEEADSIENKQTHEVDIENYDNWPAIVIDTREFKSELPGMLFRHHLRPIISMIEVGDFVLSPQMVVERKSLMDFIGSINNGRLFTQLTKMCRHYTRPILLLEFEENQPFTFKGARVKTYSLSMALEKLILALINFKNVRVLWSRSPSHTAIMFSELKKDTEDPSILCETDIALKYNTQQVDAALTLPGITSKNVGLVLDNFNSLRDLIESPEERIVKILGNEVGKMIYEFIHYKHEVQKIQTAKKTKMGSYQKYKLAKQQKK